MFQNREEAGLLLAEKLKGYEKRKDVLILAIPRGGVVVGRQLKNILHLPLSVIVVKKLGVPGNPELAIGAVAPEGVKFIDWELVLRLGVEQEYLDKGIKEKKAEVEEKEKKFKIQNGSPWSEFKIKDKKIIILVDDGIATGATVRAAIEYVKQKGKVILAVPVIAQDTYRELKSAVDEIVALEVSAEFAAVGQFYREFPQVTDEEVVKYLK